ncbi:RNA polymerase sigma-70 factor [Pedobacter hiemivivus]|uniref:RNA polymerase sigma-70 factor n=1 Tax=Pedobacter hiemivivus TaxID=2530454 RepID=A0A4U1GBJ7_9SPHI|nr:RNA polymerase sigma-70 factor [Pedobacter hiemivivus]TKC58502.1 RNA polymerase sigma-70 factor [Pedobacter hiemivivus]
MIANNQLNALTDKELVDKMSRGDEDAFQMLYKRYSGKVYNIALRYQKSAFLAQDIIQDIFLKIWQNREKLAEVDNFPGWLTTITRNHLFTQLRKQIPQLSIDEIEMDPTVDVRQDHHDVDVRELELLITEAIAALSPRQKEIYCLSRFENLSHKQIAAQLNISYDVTREHMSKALKSIRSFLIFKYMSPLFLLVNFFFIKK